MHRLLMWAPIALLILVIAPNVRAAEGRIDLELVTVGDFPIEQTREWLSMLQKLNLDGVKIRAGTEDDVPEIVSDGTQRAPAYRVKGLLTPGGNLLLKGAKFKLGDRAAIGKWMDKLKQGGEENLSATPGAFGLLPKQLAAVHAELAGPVDFSTAGGKPKDIVDKLAGKLSLMVTFESGADGALRSADSFPDQLLGISSGTALAAVLRPSGLVFVPVKGKGDSIELKITDSRSVEKSWPVGWPSSKGKGQLLPDLFKTLNVEIADTPLEESMAAIQKRVNVPFLLDQNSLARARVDLKAKVSLPKANLSYARILDKLLTQVKCKAEMRLDEADKPFLWITTLK
ncbi:MAG: hypothetical protein K8R36_10190 [Planctomycetales bacterium]|nr:hypothetical protein [Planctomycetales bacterium]